MKRLGMGTNKEDFKKRHQKIWLVWFCSAICSLVVAGFSGIYDSLCIEIRIPMGSFGILFIVFSPILPLLLWQDGQKQKQGFVKDRLEIIIVRSDMYPIYSFPHGTKSWKYEIDKIRKIRKNFFYIYIYGDILRKIFDGGALEDKRKVRSVRIPRNFTNQDQLINLDIEQYNDLQIKAKRKQEREYARLLKQMDEEESL